ncbi:hypothetical protein [Shewanella phaeophyticola]|uniref:Tetratricopeptide repeat protein n=1 Tax=Shewanella phaeophyticola TaxID=2978345 RepID=A0ABT2P3P9_9GAMM|nr:hypothetical protein [Shewanella sp. KJ10-1]MCT8987263.1 hypothetical protein [Shewanella sp. KJ10-1]
MTTRNNESWDQEYLNNQTLIYYQTYYEITNILLKHFKSSKKRIKSRILEHKKPVQITPLLQQWKDDQQFGRAKLLLQRKGVSITNLSDNDIENIQFFIKNYESIITEKDKNDNIQDIQKNSSNDKAHMKLNYFFQRRFLAGIEKMIQYTENSHNKENIEIYNLAISYRDYLNNDFNSSLVAAMKIPVDLMRESVLKHIIVLTLNLNKIPIAELYLSRIVELNDEYLPQYAQILHLQGQNQLALTSYLDYLDKYPEDVPVLLKFGLFLVNVGEVDSAKSVLLQVMSIDTNNQTAIKYLEILNK